MKTVDVYYKSYAKDFSLLKYSLMSLQKNVIGYNTIYLTIPNTDVDEYSKIVFPFVGDNIHISLTEESKLNGYLYQQVCKINAWKNSDADFILFSDSDCIFNRTIDLQDYIQGGKPEILYTDYNKVENAIIWKDPTEKFLGDPVEFEYMRRNALIYHRSTLENIAKQYPNLKKYIMESEQFSEFNAIGAWIAKNEPNKYNLVNTDNWEYTPPKAEQLWSWSEKDNPDEPHPYEYSRSLKVINDTLGLNISEI